MAKLAVDILSCCDYASVSREGKLSLMGLFDRIFVNSLPSVHPRLFFVAVLTGEAGSRYTLRLELYSPEGTPVLSNTPVEISLGANGKSNLLSEINNLKLESLGEYSLAVLVDNKQIAHTGLFVSKLAPAQISTGN